MGTGGVEGKKKNTKKVGYMRKNQVRGGKRETLPHPTLTFDEASGAREAIFRLCFTTSPVSPKGEVDTTGGDGEERDLSLETHVALLCVGGGAVKCWEY